MPVCVVYSLLFSWLLVMLCICLSVYVLLSCQVVFIRLSDLFPSPLSPLVKLQVNLLCVCSTASPVSCLSHHNSSATMFHISFVVSCYLISVL